MWARGSGLSPIPPFDFIAIIARVTDAIENVSLCDTFTTNAPTSTSTSSLLCGSCRWHGMRHKVNLHKNFDPQTKVLLPMVRKIQANKSMTTIYSLISPQIKFLFRGRIHGREGRVRPKGNINQKFFCLDTSDQSSPICNPGQPFFRFHLTFGRN